MTTRALPHFSLEEQLAYGRFNMKEIAALARISERKVRDDAQTGKLQTFLHGRQRFATGPNVRRYVQGGAAP
ncbi:hypothetical protein [Methylocystis suflitae]|uniref:hypothetical protein n=1 Tax=Methylocystis suflitae TaxID=2951405 RepID=UPI002109FAE8|nr:hypothetical protein [Methylocystis suflitae]MCQ4188584.1 hypothetical protein [Methylocystis suflitae]